MRPGVAFVVRRRRTVEDLRRATPPRYRVSTRNIGATRLALDAELADARLERRGLRPRRCAAPPSPRMRQRTSSSTARCVVARPPAASSAGRPLPHRGRGSSTCSAGPGAQDDRALDQVAQLPHVAGPGVALKGSHRAPSNLLDRLPALAANSRTKCPHQQRDVLVARSRSGGTGWGRRSAGRRGPRGTLPGADHAARSRLVAAMTRTSTRDGPRAAQRRELAAPAGRAAAWPAARAAARRSRPGERPPVGDLERPVAGPAAPVYAPRSRPKSSASISVRRERGAVELHDGRVPRAPRAWRSARAAPCPSPSRRAGAPRRRSGPPGRPAPTPA